MRNISYDRKVAAAIGDLLELIEPYVNEYCLGEHFHRDVAQAYDPNSFGAFGREGGVNTVSEDMAA